MTRTHAAFDEEGATALKASPKCLLSLLQPFQSSAEVAATAGPDTLSVRSYVPEVSAVGGAAGSTLAKSLASRRKAVLRTEMTIASTGFDAYRSV